MLINTLINITLLISIVAIVGGVVCILLGGNMFAGGRETKSWPPAQGVIIKSQQPAASLWSKLFPRPHIVYEYQAGGHHHRSQSLFFGSDFMARFPPAELQTLIKKYHRGHRVTVYYNPHNPQEAVLEPGPRWGLVWGLPLLGLLLFFGGIISTLTIIM